MKQSLLEVESALLCSLNQANATQNLVIAYSGGVDSHVLLVCAANLQSLGHISTLSAIHVNHGLQTMAKDWQLHCQQICDNLHIPLTIYQLHPPSEHNQVPQKNIEAEVRKGRYQYFESHLVSGQCLLMAHHLDDQAETLLFRLLRGSGIKGAGAIPKSRVLGKGRLLRPLLDVSRAQIEDYASYNQLKWVSDPSNQLESYSRNYLRHQVIPKLKQKWPGLNKTFARFSKIAQQQSELLDEIAQQDLNQASQQEKALAINQIKLLSPNRQKNLLHYWGKQLTASAPSNNEIEELVRQLSSHKETAIHLNFAGASVRQFNGNLLLAAKQQPQDQFQKVIWQDFSIPIGLTNQVCITAILSDQALLRAPRADETVYIDCRQGGERCLPEYRQHSTLLKKVYQELNVPPWLRSWLPIVYYNEQIAAVPGVFVSKPFLTDASTAGWQLQVKPN